ncbi:MAG: cysteine--tRNA ligase, partial [Desulfovibrionaceae bacterium]|nr:cysteine--tRNA ligase [Desulfovibrionaceae bacterium]
MQIFNTASRSKESLVPVRPGRIHMYVCGVTVYDYCHIGHARSALVFDVLVRHLRRQGLDVTFVRNFTDVDDKIINRANREGRDWKEVAETYIRAFHEDMDALGVLRADVEPRATEHMQDILDMVQSLVDQGSAYATPSGDVYFRVRSMADYGKLSHRSLDDMQAGARVAVGDEKEDPMDFALWKAAKPGEPYWESPWGRGRPGWHIECSAMSRPYLPLDIHGGGMDLVFPHHENEIAQTECACHCSLANLWMHNAFVQINSEKMSKSLGNFKTIRDILETWLPETLRFFLLSKHYRSPVDFTPEGMNDAERALSRVYEALAAAKEGLARAKWKRSPLPAETAAEWSALSTGFLDAMEDDLNTAQALGHVFSMVRIVNRLLEDKALRASEAVRDLLQDFLARMEDVTARTGLFGDEPKAFLVSLRASRCVRLAVDVPQVEALVAARAEARAAKDFALSDSLRDKLRDMKVEVRDTPQGQVWDLVLAP